MPPKIIRKRPKPQEELMSTNFTLKQYDIDANQHCAQRATAHSLPGSGENEAEAAIADSGALMVRSGAKTGRSPKDKRIVKHPASEGDIWWGSVNIAIEERTFAANRERAIDYLNTLDKLYVVDGFGGWDPNEQIKVRIICTRPITRCSCGICSFGRLMSNWHSSANRIMSCSMPANSRPIAIRPV